MADEQHTGHEHEHHDHHDHHGHSHGHCGHDHGHPHKSSLRERFQNACAYVSQKRETFAIATAGLMGTTALVAPQSLGMMGAATLVAAAAWLLGNKNKTVLSFGKKFLGRDFNVSARDLGLAAGAAALAIPFAPVLGVVAAGAGAIGLLKVSSENAVANILNIGRKRDWKPDHLGFIVGALTTVPELAVSLWALHQGQMETSLGNVVGGNIAHTLAILGAVAAIAGIKPGKEMNWKFNTAVMAASTGMFGYQLVNGTMSQPMGVAMLLTGLGYLGVRIYNNRKKQNEVGNCVFHEGGHSCHDQDHHGEGHPDHDHHGDHDDGHHHGQSLDLSHRTAGASTGWGTAGMAALTGASTTVVAAAAQLSNGTGIDPAFIGPVLVGLGIALPELALSINAARQKESEFAVSNVIGCNIFTTLIVGGAIAAFHGHIPADLLMSSPQGALNTAFYIGSAALATGALFLNGGALNKKHGLAGLGLYGAYLAAAAGINVAEHNKPKPPAELPKPVPIVQRIAALPRPQLPAGVGFPDGMKGPE